MRPIQFFFRKHASLNHEKVPKLRARALHSFFHKNQKMWAEDRMFLILIHIFSNSHPIPTSNTCLKCFTRPKLSFGKSSYSNLKKFRCSFRIVLIKRKECIKFKRVQLLFMFCFLLLFCNVERMENALTAVIS